jgi:hypothetical protein
MKEARPYLVGGVRDLAAGGCGWERNWGGGGETI